MIDRAIYYPYIDVNNADRAWFSKILLYWDQVGSIVPHEIIESQTLIGDYMNELMNNDLVTAIAPGDYVGDITHFVEPFLKLVDNSPIITERKKTAFKFGLTTPLHLEKMFPLIDPLCERGLARKWSSMWYQVESITAYQFMAYLSSVLGRHKEIQMTPVTDQPDKLDEFQSGALQPTEIRLHQIRSDIIDHILPAPENSVSASEIIEFKLEHGNLLSVFRRNVEKAITNIAKTEDDFLREREVAIYKAELDEDLKYIWKMMNERNWGRILMGFIKGVRVGIPIGTLLAQGITGSEYLRIPGLIVAIYEAHQGLPNDQKAILNEPLAYSVYAQKRFGSLHRSSGARARKTS